MSKQRQAFEYIIPMAMNIDKFKLMRNQVIVEYDPKQVEKTPSGIYAPVGALNHDIAAFCLSNGKNMVSWRTNTY